MGERLARWGAALGTFARRMVGMPDYAAYLAHHERSHPGCPPKTEREFFEEYLSRRYDGGPTRCC